PCQLGHSHGRLARGCQTNAVPRVIPRRCTNPDGASHSWRSTIRTIGTNTHWTAPAILEGRRIHRIEKRETKAAQKRNLVRNDHHHTQLRNHARGNPRRGPNRPRPRNSGSAWGGHNPDRKPVPTNQLHQQSHQHSTSLSSNSPRTQPPTIQSQSPRTQRQQHISRSTSR